MINGNGQHGVGGDRCVSGENKTGGQPSNHLLRMAQAAVELELHPMHPAHLAERELAEEVLKHEQLLLRTLIDQIPDFVYVKDVSFRFIAANTAVARAMGAASPEDVLGKTDADFYPAEAERGYRADEEQIFCTGQPLLNKNEPRVINGQPRSVLTTKIPLRDAAGKIIGLVGISRDITELRAAQEELSRAKAEADRANTAKSQFLAHMSHDLRTPMNAIVGMTELALCEELSPAVRDCLQTVQESADALLNLLNEILDLSRIEAGMLQWDPIAFSLRSVLDNTLKALNVRACKKGLDVIGSISADVPERLMGDPMRLRQVLTNLIGNAIKFTARGQVEVRVAVEQGHSDMLALQFTVRDTGIGISADNLERVFEPYVQADPTTAHNFGGSGLGLQIAKLITKMAGGRIWAESELGVGSQFHFTIPMVLSSEPTDDAGRANLPDDLPEDRRETPPIWASQAARPLRILLAEDTEANEKLVVRILGKRGHSVEIARDGQQALALLQHTPVDVVLMDVQMPVMDGFLATKAIRGMSDPAKARLPIIAMTACALKGDHERCLAAGMDAYLPKPIDSRAMIRLIEQLARRG